MNNNSQVPWKVRLGKMGNDEWAADVTFTAMSDEQWAAIRSLAEKYAKFNSRVCPPVSASDNGRRLRFRLGHAMEKPQSVDKLSSVECETLHNNLVGCCEGLYKNGLGLRHLDRELVWKVDGSFTFVPVFWLPALPEAVPYLPDIAPECSTEAITEPSMKADMYAIASYCYRALTGRRHDPNNSILPGDLDPRFRTWDAILDPALRKSLARRPDSFQDWLRHRPNQVSASNSVPPSPPRPPAVPQRGMPVAAATTEAAEVPTKPQRSYRRWVITVILLFSFLYLVRTYMPDLMRKIPVINLAAPSYQRGTGPYVVRYADRSYDRASWKSIWSTKRTNDNGRLEHISGWDKDNFAAGGYSLLVWNKQGHWDIQTDGSFNGGLFFTNTNVFYVCDRMYQGNSYKTLDNHFYRFYQIENGSVTGVSDEPYEIQNNKEEKIRSDEKRYKIWKDDNTSSGDRGNITRIECIRSYKPGLAVGFYSYDDKLVKYKNGLWYEHEKKLNFSPGTCWSVDTDNFVIAGQNGMAQSYKGEVRNINVSVSGWTFDGRWIAVWGVSMDKWRAMDDKGNVVQIEGDQQRGVVRGPKFDDEDERFQEAWVSPEGVVYAITRKEIYRLD